MKRPAFQTTVEDIENLKALPHDTVLLDADNDWYQIYQPAPTTRVPNREKVANRFGSEWPEDLGSIALPAIVVFRPVDKS